MALPHTNEIDIHMAKAKPLVSVIVAIKNQKEYLEQLNSDLRRMQEDSESSFEIIYVDDGSTDSSWRMLKEIGEKSPNTHLIKLRTAFGESSALEAAMESALGDWIVFYTSRVRVNARDLSRLVDRLAHADVVVGARFPRRDSGLNQFVSKIFNRITNKIAKLDLRDINSGVFAVRRDVLERVPFYGALNSFLPLLASRQGYKVVEEPVEQLPGKFDQSLKAKDYVRRFLDLISVVFLSRYSKKPLHFLGFGGAIMAVVGAAIDLYLFIYRILGFGGIAGRPILLLGTVCLVIGLQMIAIGLLGEMIIFTHARQIREYNIEEIVE
ncbi:glycosyltransferase [candidate division KSB1 bacterium]|nr:glycosyltransferase [candidate division KSB1 bacterium]RQW01906.1 MAG: glycosyltransferase [candidate division KSB1 bacterium]